MAWVIASKTGQELVELSRKTPDFTLTQLQTIIPINYGGVDTDYSFHELSYSELSKVNEGYDFDLNWVSDEVTSLDFSAHENKKWVKIILDKEDIDDDGVETVTVTVELWKADMSGIATNVNATSRIPILTPTGERWSKATLVNGVMTKNFKTTKSGKWVFPSRSKKFLNVRVMNQAVLEVNETSILS